MKDKTKEVKDFLKDLLLEKQTKLEELDLFKQEIKILEKELSDPTKINLVRVGIYSRKTTHVMRDVFLEIKNLKIDDDLKRLIKKTFIEAPNKTVHSKGRERIIGKNTEEATMISILLNSKAELTTIEEIIVTIHDLILKERADQGPLYSLNFSVSKPLHIGFIKHEDSIYDVWISRKRHGHDPGTLGTEFIVHWEKNLSWIYHPNTESLI